jgi:large subunit ribosomal protein L31
MVALQTFRCPPDAGATRQPSRPVAPSRQRGLKCRSYPAALGAAMKADIHPDYREVVFQDMTSDFKFLTRSTLSSKETVKWKDGNEYPLIKVDISSASHPFYTGQNKIMDTSGRVDKFRKRYATK